MTGGAIGDMDSQSIVDLRKNLHRYPELSGEETCTADLIKNELNKTKPTRIIDKVRGHSIIAEYCFAGKGPTVLLRCELDALPIQEQNEFSHKSSLEGISHKCGHDGHMSIMLGVANDLHIRPLSTGKVLLLFQSAEETGEGAKQVADYLRDEAINIDYVFALHNIPGMELNSISCKKGIFSPEVISIDINLRGRVSHAAEPEGGISPALAIADTIRSLHDMNNPEKESDNFFLITPIEVKMGNTAYGIAAGDGIIRYTMRTWGTESLSNYRLIIENTLAKIIQQTKGLEYSIDWHQEFRANINDDTAVEIIEKASLACGLNFIEMDQPLSFGEDFGFLTSQYPGAMFCVGAGKDCKPLHDTFYDFPDKIIYAGIQVFSEILRSIINQVQANE